MTTQLDASIGIKKESVYGTPATVDAFFEYLEETFDDAPTYVSGKGLRVGKIMQRSDRRVLGKEATAGDITLEAFSKGLGKLFAAALGTGVSTNITGTAYQQLFTPKTADFLDSYTIQKAIPVLGGAPSQQTYAGCVCSGFELDVSNSDEVTIKFSFGGRSVDTSTAYATPSYIAANQLFAFVHASLAIGGTVVPPTTTALGSGGTNTVDISDLTITWDNGLDTAGYNFGSQGKRSRVPALGERVGTGQLTVEYDADTFRNAWNAQTDLALLLTLQLPAAITGSNFPTLQVCVPELRFEGEMPKSNKGDVVTQTIPFTILDGGVAASPLYVAIVTPETAI
jgi:hypothetical protein